MMLLIMILFFSGAASALPHEDIIALRKEQKTMPYHIYAEIENKIEHIKNNAHHKRLNLCGWYHVLPYVAWQMLLILLVWFTCWCCYRFTTSKRRLSYWAILWLFLWGLSSFAIAGYYYEYYHPRAIVINEQAFLRVGPAHDYPYGYKLNYLDELYVREKKDEWYRVDTNNKAGWIAAHHIMMLST